MVSGLVTPDSYLVDKITFTVVKQTKGARRLSASTMKTAADIKTAEGPEADRNKFLHSQRRTDGSLQNCQSHR